VLGIPLDFSCVGKSKDSSPTLDRFYPNKGYVKNNIAIMSWRANTLKCDATVDELEKVVLWMKNFQGPVNSGFFESAMGFGI
jgi:hypothetical protein